MDLDIKSMRERAMAATPGPWDAYHPAHPKLEADAVHHRGPADDGCLAKVWGGSANAAHIAGLDPGTVLALLDRLEQADRERDAAIREADRLRHDSPVECDFVYPDSLALTEARAALARIVNVIAEAGCDCECMCPAGECEPDHPKCLGCRVESAMRTQVTR